MEVRLSELATIVGTTPNVIRGAIQHNKLPFLDDSRNDEDTKRKIARRTYSVSDAFLWFFSEQLARALGVHPWSAAGKIRSLLPRGLNAYLKVRFSGQTAANSYAVFGSNLPNAGQILSDQLEWSIAEFVIDDEFSDEVKNKYTFVTTVHLDPIFDLFKQVIEGRGWSFDQGGFTKPSDVPSTRKRMMALHQTVIGDE